LIVYVIVTAGQLYYFVKMAVSCHWPVLCSYWTAIQHSRRIL